MNQNKNERCRENKYKCVFLDLDDTLVFEYYERSRLIDIDRNKYLCKDTMKCLEYLKNNNYKVVLTSLNSRGFYIIKSLGLMKYFNYIISYEADDKRDHLISAYLNMNLLPGECILFDDLMSNITTANELKIDAFHVNYKYGLLYEDMINALEK